MANPINSSNPSPILPSSKTDSPLKAFASTISTIAQETFELIKCSFTGDHANVRKPLVTRTTLQFTQSAQTPKGASNESKPESHPKEDPPSYNDLFPPPPYKPEDMSSKSSEAHRPPQSNPGQEISGSGVATSTAKKTTAAAQTALTSLPTPSTAASSRFNETEKADVEKEISEFLKTNDKRYSDLDPSHKKLLIGVYFKRFEQSDCTAFSQFRECEHFGCKTYKQVLECKEYKCTSYKELLECKKYKCSTYEQVIAFKESFSKKPTVEGTVPPEESQNRSGNQQTTTPARVSTQTASSSPSDPIEDEAKDFYKDFGLNTKDLKAQVKGYKTRYNDALQLLGKLPPDKFPKTSHQKFAQACARGKLAEHVRGILNLKDLTTYLDLAENLNDRVKFEGWIGGPQVYKEIKDSLKPRPSPTPPPSSRPVETPQYSEANFKGFEDQLDEKEKKNVGLGIWEIQRIEISNGTHQYFLIDPKNPDDYIRILDLPSPSQPRLGYNERRQ